MPPERRLPTASPKCSRCSVICKWERSNKQKLHHFDSWAATFGEPVTAMELAPDGAGYRLNTRFARFINVPELMQIFCQVADIQTADKLKLPVPEMQTGKPMIVRAPSTPELKEIVKGLVERAEAIRSGRVPPEEDNMLKITTEGRKAALDLRVLNPRAKDHPESKINLAADKIFQIWKDTHENRCAQLVFCDLSTPSKLSRQFCAYDDLKDKAGAARHSRRTNRLHSGLRQRCCKNMFCSRK